jgi:hypothetical protein
VIGAAAQAMPIGDSAKCSAPTTKAGPDWWSAMPIAHVPMASSL